MYLNDFADPANFPDRIRELPKKFLPMPDLASLPRGKHSGSAPFHSPLVLLAHYLLQRLLVGYDKNRGGQPIDLAKVKRMFGKNGEGIFIEALDEINFGESDSVAHATPLTGEFTLAKAHHRMSFVLYLYWMASEKVWNDIKDEVVSCRVYDVKKLVPLYIKDGDVVHPSKDSYLRNPDMVLGNIISCDPDPAGKFNGRLASRLSIPARNLLGSKGGYLQPVANLLYALHVKTCTYAATGQTVDLRASQAVVYNCRQKVKKFIELPFAENKKTFPVSDEILDKVANAIEDYMTFRSCYKMEIERREVNLEDVSVQKKILSQTAFFAYFIYDRAIFDLMPASNLVAERLAYHCNGPTKLGENVNFLWNGDSVVINQRALDIIAALRKTAPKPPKTKK